MSSTKWLIVIVMLAAVLRFFPIWFGLPYAQARPDEETSIGRALGVLEHEPNPGFFHWPSLTFYLFAGLLWLARAVHRLAGLTGELTLSGQTLVTRGAIAAVGTVTTVVLFRLARGVAGERVALMAAAFLAVAILHVRESHFAMTDVLMTFLLWSSLLVLLDAVVGHRSSTPVGAYAGAGLIAGLATSTKYNAAAIACAMVAAQALLVARAPRTLSSWRGWAPSIAYGSAMFAAVLAGTPYSVLDPSTFWRDFTYNFDHLAEGHRGITLGRGWGYHATHSLPYGVGVPVWVAAIVGAVPFARDHRAAAALLGAFAVPFYIIVGSGYTVFFRYVLPLVPLACLSAAIGVDRLADWIAAHWRVRRRVVLAALLLLTAGPSLVQSVWFDVLLARTDTRVLAAHWLGAQVRPDDTLHDASSPFTRVDLPPGAVRLVEYDKTTGVFTDGRLPDWLVVYESPLSAYASISPQLQGLSQVNYRLVYSVHATRGRARSAVYDRQDAFFLPFSRFATVERPGPTIFVYRRSDLPALAR